MSASNCPARPHAGLRWAARVAALVCLGLPPLAAADQPKPGPGRPAVGKVAPGGALAERAPGAASWRLLKPGDSVHSGDQLVALPITHIDGANGAVRMDLLADLSRSSPFPVMESAVTLYASAAADLEFSLDRGRIDVVNTRQSGPAKVRVRVREATWELTLESPGSTVALESYGRWPGGVPFRLKPRADEEPVTDVAVVVLKGAAELNAVTATHALGAPPGPAFYHWDSASGGDPGPRRLDKVPAWADPASLNQPEAQARGAILNRLAERMRQESLEKVLAAAVKADDPAVRRYGVIGYGALDDLPHLFDALTDSQHPDVRDTAVQVLRHWIGRGPGQDLKLYESLLANNKLNKARAATVLQLLHSFSPADATRADTFEQLIDYLGSDSPAVRELAYWHLLRLAGSNVAVPFDSAGPEEERKKAVEAWRKLLTEGKIFPKKP
jgi:hypothetical protein